MSRDIPAQTLYLKPYENDKLNLGICDMTKSSVIMK
jgi:hypothetical protein